MNNDLIYNLSAKVVISRQVIAIFHWDCDETSPENRAFAQGISHTQPSSGRFRFEMTAGLLLTLQQ